MDSPLSKSTFEAIMISYTMTEHNSKKRYSQTVFRDKPFWITDI